MNLDYSVKPTEQEIKNDEIEITKSYPYKSARNSDQYRDFVSMQKTVNTALAKSKEDDNMTANKPGDANLDNMQTGNSWGLL